MGDFYKKSGTRPTPSSVMETPEKTNDPVSDNQEDLDVKITLPTLTMNGDLMKDFSKKSDIKLTPPPTIMIGEKVKEEKDCSPVLENPVKLEIKEEFEEMPLHCTTGLRQCEHIGNLDFDHFSDFNNHKTNLPRWTPIEVTESSTYLVASGCKACQQFFMVENKRKACPKCGGVLVRFV